MWRGDFLCLSITHDDSILSNMDSRSARRSLWLAVDDTKAHISSTARSISSSFSVPFVGPLL